MNKLKNVCGTEFKTFLGNHDHTYYMTFTDKILNCTEHKYHKAQEIVSVTMCYNTDPDNNFPR